MKLVTDDRCRLQSRDLLKPNTPYDGEKDPAGRVILVELGPVSPEKARLVRRNGRTCLVSDRELTNEDVQKALAEFP
jgi:hypothetical protein